MDRQEINGEGASLHYSYAFMIAQLHHLTLRGFRIDPEDGLVDPEFERTTELKSLHIEKSFVSFPALAAALRAPRALEYLGIAHTDDYQHHEIHSSDDNNSTMKEFMDVLLLHRESLEGIRVVYQDAYRSRGDSSKEPPKINVASFLPYAKQFPKMKHWEGCDGSSMRMFLRCRDY